MTLVDIIDAGRSVARGRTFARTPDGREMSYDQLDTTAACFGRAVAEAGVRVGDRVAVQVDKSLDAVALHVALLRVGAVQLPLNPGYTDAETCALLADAQPTLVIRRSDRPLLPGSWATLTMDSDGGGSLADLAQQVGERSWQARGLDEGDPAAMLYTSGTTGRPKAAVLSHSNLAHNARNLVDAWGFTSDDNLMHVLPLFHTHGLFVALHCVLASGASMTFLPRFEVQTVVEEMPDCTVFMGVPTHYGRLLADPRFTGSVCGSVRVFISGSAPMSMTTHAAFTERTGAVVLERYGMTETSMLTSNPLLAGRKPGSVGQPLPGVELRVVDASDADVPVAEVGAVQVRGPNVFAGYWRRPELQSTEFTGDGWFRTGDLGRLDDDGYLSLVGRSKDLVISGGLNVYPSEVESVLDQLPGVAESAVIGVADADLGEVVVAVVVAEAGAAPDPATIRSGCRARLAGFKVPKEVRFVEQLPRNAMGKVEKARLRADWHAERGADQ